MHLLFFHQAIYLRTDLLMIILKYYIIATFTKCVVVVVGFNLTSVHSK